MRHAGDMHLPGPLRAAVGLAATAATEAKHLPDRAIELPMLVVSSALQASLRAQQRYARFTARGDEVLNRRTPTAQPPSWATFDEPVSAVAATPPAGRSAFEHLFGVEDPTLAPDGREPVDEVPPPDEPPLVPEAPSATPAVVKAAARKQAAKKAAAKTARKTAVKKTAAKKTAAKKLAAPGDPALARAKTVSKPRHATPSAFDNVTDDATDA